MPRVELLKGIVVLEHRFYGEFNPAPPTTLHRRSLADAANFRWSQFNAQLVIVRLLHIRGY